jgi:hypothetical protein
MPVRLGLPARTVSVTNIARARHIVFGQIRTHELRNSAQFAKSGWLRVGRLSCNPVKVYVQIAQPREMPKAGSSPVRAATLFS